MADPIPLSELLARLRAIDALSDADAVREAKELIEVAKATLQAYIDMRVWRASRDRPNAQAAAELGMAVPTVANRATRHKKRTPHSEG